MKNLLEILKNHKIGSLIYIQPIGVVKLVEINETSNYPITVELSDFKGLVSFDKEGNFFKNGQNETIQLLSTSTINN